MTAISGGHADAQPVGRTLSEASKVLTALEAIPAQCIPPALLADAQGIAIIPRVIKAGFVIGGKAGHGVVMSKNPDGTWGGPAFVEIGGVSAGLQAGVQSTDLVLVFKTRASLDRVLRGKEKVTLGVDASVAAGPLGREAIAATDARLRAEIYSYSRSRGLFAGVSFDGAVIANDFDMNRAYRTAPPEVLAWSERLKSQIMVASGQHPVVVPGVRIHPAPNSPVPPIYIPPPPRQ
jgi:lipid-binding SYLF domain-containing protein